MAKTVTITHSPSVSGDAHRAADVPDWQFIKERADLYEFAFSAAELQRLYYDAAHGFWWEAKINKKRGNAESLAREDHMNAAHMKARLLDKMPCIQEYHARLDVLAYRLNETFNVGRAAA